MTVVEEIENLLDVNALSALAAEMIERARPSVVQVRSAGRGGGAGVVWRTDGAILTNDHVVGQAARVAVQLGDEQTFEARVVERNRTLDLALLQVDADDLPAALVGDSAGLRVGELVFAIGHPWGQRDTVTAGIVSGVGEIAVGANRTAQYIRSDVRLLPGNSGGPLVNARGEVIGINAMVFGGDLGVAIPSHVAIDWIAGLPSRGVTLGVQVQPVELPAAVRNNGRTGRAAALLVVGVEPGSLAERSGLLLGDALLEFGDTPLEDADALRDALRHHRAPTLRFSVLRGGTVQTVELHAA